MKNIEQLRKLMDEVEFSKSARERLNQIFDDADAKGGLDEDIKNRLLEVIKADMAVDAIEIQTLDAAMSEIDKAVAEVEQ